VRNFRVSTPVGGATVAGALATILLYFAGLWPPFEHLPGQVQGAVQVLVTAVLVYLGGWLQVVRSPGQTATIGLTASRLPTVQMEDAAPGSPGAPTTAA
jgi:hypothetical protein